MNNDTLDTCEHCGCLYDPDVQGHEHDPDCECCYCDPMNPEHDYFNATPIIDHVQKFGRLCFCSQECEYNFVNGRRYEI